MRKLSLVLMLAFFVSMANAQSKLGVYTTAFLENYATAQTRMATDMDSVRMKQFVTPKRLNRSVATIGVFITLNEGTDVDALKALGVEIYAQVGDLVTAEVPVDQIVAISELKEVKYLEVEKPVKLLMEKSREYTNVSQVQAGTGLNRAYTGAGVVVGICDTGIEFNHIAFKDANGNTRVKRAYLPDDYTGTRPSGEGGSGGKFSGSEYTTPEKISKITTDNSRESHGTHTSNIAAGSYFENNYYGNATGADLVLCGLQSLSDLNVINSVLYTFNYAESVGKPAVVNLSLGGHQGAHDGTSSINRYLDAISGEGRIVSLSAGNEGNSDIYVSKTFQSSTDELKTFLLHSDDKRRNVSAYVDTWSRTSSVIGVKGVVYNTTTNQVVYETPVFKWSRVSESKTYSSYQIPELAKYYAGSIRFIAKIDSQNNKFNLLVNCSLKIPNFNTSTLQPNYAFGLVYTGGEGTQMDAWVADNATYFASEGVPGWTAGSAACSINDMATGNNTLSVGSYDSSRSYKNSKGQTYNYNGISPGYISSFSSYGPDANGIQRPDIVAPGAVIISAVNGYDSSTVGTTVRNYLAAEVKGEDRTYYWGPMMGTSMSCPAVTGIIALWLEADKTLTPTRIKEIFRKTAIRDEQVISGDANRWGYGKIDAYAGLVEVLKGTTGIGAIENRNKVVISTLGDRMYRIYAPGETGKVTVNVYNPNGTLLYTTVGGHEGEIEVKLPDFGGSGVAIMQVVGEKTNFRTKVAL